MNTMSVDFSKTCGKLRSRLHGAGYMPNMGSASYLGFAAEFSKLNFHEARTHDQALANPGQRVVDTHFVFPNINADPDDPSNYYFGATDHLLEACIACGPKILYRLGTSIEHTQGRHFNAITPSDFDKYTEVLAGIVRHCNRGWAGGGNFGIEYWEVWNEPDLGAQMWSGTLDEYFRFYGTVAKRLKGEFPEIKIGGPAFCFLDETKAKAFLAYCRDGNVPLDFFSWHSYTSDLDGIVAQPAVARRLLDAFGFVNTETMMNEWHYLLSWQGLHRDMTPENCERAMTGSAGIHGIDSAAFNVSAISRWHDTPLDSAHYYGCDSESAWGFHTPYRALNKNYYSMYLVGQMMKRFPHRVAVAELPATVSAIAGVDGLGNCGLLLADYRGDAMEIAVELVGIPSQLKLSALLLDHESDLVEIVAEQVDRTMVLRKAHPGSAVFFVTGEASA